jgi:uncharacterized protein with LGFP repeats
MRSGCRGYRRAVVPRGVAVAALVCGPLLAGSLEPATATPREHPVPDASRLASAAPTARALRGVPPRITNLRVATVPRHLRAAVSASLAAAHPRHDALVAHLRRRLTSPFSMVGVTWDNGTAPPHMTVRLRTRSQGSWSRWSTLVIDPAEGPAPGQDTTARAGTDPYWTGPATGVEVAVYDPSGVAPRNLDVNAINPGSSPQDAAVAGSQTASSEKSGPRAGTFPAMPRIITRAQWGADPKLTDRCWKPRIGTKFSMVFIHHTASSNHYTAAQAPGIVRGIYAYHTQSRGWCDIAYNFLVDRYGNIYEGRRGGITRPVRGAHAGDYNLNTTGIALIGNFMHANPTRRMKHSLVQLVAWRMGTAYHGAYGHPKVHGKRFKRISGHRDAMSTSCPGNRAYKWLPKLRQRVAARLGNFESPIEARWRKLGGPHSDLGPVRIGEQRDHGGQHTTFQTGRMYNSRRGGLHTLYKGAVLAKYLHIGETRSDLGYPASNLHKILHGKGTSATFLRGRIFSSRATGTTVLVRSAILKRYIALNGPAGRLGLPTVPVHRTKVGSLARFQHGTIAYDRDRHKTVVTYR